MIAELGFLFAFVAIGSLFWIGRSLSTIADCLLIMTDELIEDE